MEPVERTDTERLERVLMWIARNELGWMGRNCRQCSHELRLPSDHCPKCGSKMEPGGVDEVCTEIERYMDAEEEESDGS